MAMNSTAELPPELLHLIFDYLHPSDDDWTTSWPIAQKIRQPLSSCTLVSRSWYPIAQQHLFHDIVWSFRCSMPNDSADSTRSHIISRHRRAVPPPKTLEMLDQFLEESPEICPSIKRLKLACYPVSGHAFSTQYPPIYDKHIDRLSFLTLLLVLRKLPRLEVLHTWNVFLDPQNLPPILGNACSQPLSLKTLKIEEMRGPRRTLCYSVGLLLLCCDQLEGLEFAHPNGIHVCAPKTFPDVIPFRVQSLLVSGMWYRLDADRILDLLRLSPLTRTSLRRVVLHCVSLEVVPAVQALVRALGSSIKDFTIIFQSGDRLTSQLDLSAMNALRELSIGMYIAMDGTTDTLRSPFFGNAVELLSTVVALSPASHPRLNVVNFHFGHIPVSGRRVVDRDLEFWKYTSHATRELDLALGQLVKRFSLAGIFFECSDDPVVGRDALQTVIPHMFPHMARNGLIMFKNDSSLLLTSLPELRRRPRGFHAYTHSPQPRLPRARSVPSRKLHPKPIRDPLGVV